MQIVIEIPEETKQAFDRANNDDINFCFYDYNSVIGKAIKNGTVLPQNPTNGDMIKAMFGCEEVHRYRGAEPIIVTFFNDQTVEYSNSWWNAPYERGEG